jgi:hypothetical protein
MQRLLGEACKQASRCWQSVELTLKFWIKGIAQAVTYDIKRKDDRD